MRQRLWSVLTLIAATAGSLTPSEARAGAIVEINGSPCTTCTLTPNGTATDIVIDVGTISTDTLVRIYGASSGAFSQDEIIGSVLIQGSIQTGTTPRLDVLVAGPVTTDFPLITAERLHWACSGFGGTGSNAGLRFANQDLRHISRLAMSLATGDITGEIQAGKVFRIQCGKTYSDESTAGGNITGNVIASRADGVFDGFEAIGVIRAGNSISGDVIAQGGVAGLDDSNATGSITLVAVGPTLTASGISGDILAEKGKIKSVFSTGPIGSTTESVKIYAGTGIEEVRATDANEPSTTPLTRDFYVDMQASRAFTNTVATGGPNVDAALKLVNTGGSVNGSVAAANVTFNGFVHSGIIAGGPITADINVDLNLENADIIGSTITGEIKIGMKAKGAIVATDRGAGEIASVEIGYAADPPELYVQLFPRGFVGNACPPVNEVTPAVWYAPPCLDNGTADSVIRAKSIQHLKLASMTQIANLPTGLKQYAARVESPEIYDLQIDDMQSGVVWSGELDDLVDGSGPNDPSNDYSSIDTLRVGCVGPGADIWVQDCSNVRIDHDVLGEIHVPTLLSSQVVWIGGRLGDAPSPLNPGPGDLCECTEPTGFCFYSETELNEASPRDMGYADVGGVFIGAPLGLAGQVIINGNESTPAPAWKGRVVVGDYAVPPAERFEISPDSTVDGLIAPFYTKPSILLGGGAVGLAPFHLYGEDCTPAHNSPAPASWVLESAFDNTSNKPVKIGHYGPVKKGLIPNWNMAVKIQAQPIGHPDSCEWWDASGGFKVYGPTTEEPRAIRLGRATDAHPRPGAYRVIVYDDVMFTIRRILSENVTGDPGVRWEKEYCDPEDEELVTEVYRFVIAPDCDHDGIRDDIDPQIGCLINCGIADFNQYGGVTVQDLFDFLAAYFATPGSPNNCWEAPAPRLAADVNDSGCVSVQDIFDYLAAYFGSPGCPICPGDPACP